MIEFMIRLTKIIPRQNALHWVFGCMCSSSITVLVTLSTKVIIVTNQTLVSPSTKVPFETGITTYSCDKRKEIIRIKKDSPNKESKFYINHLVIYYKLAKGNVYIPIQLNMVKWIQMSNVERLKEDWFIKSFTAKFSDTKQFPNITYIMTEQYICQYWQF